jgi:hypothetical protein
MLLGLKKIYSYVGVDSWELRDPKTLLPDYSYVPRFKNFPER